MFYITYYILHAPIYDLCHLLVEVMIDRNRDADSPLHAEILLC